MPLRRENIASSTAPTARRALGMKPRLPCLLDFAFRSPCLAANEQWSPEQISGWLKVNHDIHISHTWIYQHVEKDRQEEGELSNHMRRGKYSFEPREYKGKIKNRTTIEQRPDTINNRERLGDFEIDLIVGPKNKGAILTVIDRLSRYCIIEKLSSKGSKEVKHAVIEIFKNYNGKRYSITSDNGNEFMLHEVIAQDVNIDYYFARLL